MSDIAIKFENISKQYRLGEIGTGTLSHDLNRWWHKARGHEDPYLKIGETNDRTRKGESDYIWALRDIDFEVKKGEVLGIIGKNGAGKSTLLKILSKVTKPTTGLIKANGRIASLLEVGTGFHPEMTGRENIYMNGAIMGMTKAEITRKFDEIVDFAGVERYIDTPVKRYSSGMTVRLGFAIAAHLEPEILVVDEVLAVGDAEFQKKAIGKMQDVSKNQGRTVLFVSHNMGAIRTLCPKTLILEKGKIIKYCSTEDAIITYLSINTTGSLEYIATNSEKTHIAYARLIDSNNKSTNSYDFGKHIRCEIVIKTHEIPRGTFFTIALQNKYKNRVFSSDHTLDEFQIDANKEFKFIFEFPYLPYAPGIYSLNIALHLPNLMMLELLDDIMSFEVFDKGSNLSKYTSFCGDMLIQGKIDTLQD